MVKREKRPCESLFVVPCRAGAGDLNAKFFLVFFLVGGGVFVGGLLECLLDLFVLGVGNDVWIVGHSG